MRFIELYDQDGPVFIYPPAVDLVMTPPSGGAYIWIRTQSKPVGVGNSAREVSQKLEDWFASQSSFIQGTQHD